MQTGSLKNKNKPLSCQMDKARQLIIVIIVTFSMGTALAQPNRIELPSIGDPADRFLSPAQEYKLGSEFLRNVYRHDAVLEDPEISSYIQHLGNELSNTLSSDTHRFTLFVVKDDSINAFAVPGGFIGVNSGLILASDSESELASVVAHEISHVSQRHIARRIASMSSSAIPALGAVLAGMLLASSGSGDVGRALVFGGVAAQQQQLLNFSRNMEIEADRIGLDILYRSGFDPRGMPAFFRTLQRNRYSSVQKEFAFLITHPLDNVRITEAQNRINRLPGQEHTSSQHYLYAKARLQALASNDPNKLIDLLESQKKTKPYEWYAYSQALERKNLFEKAEAVLLPLIKTEPEVIPLQLALARIKLHSKQPQKANEILKKMIELYPDNFAINIHYSQSLMQSGQAVSGKNLLKKYLADYTAPTLQAYKLMAELHQQCGEFIESKKILADYYFEIGNPNAAVFQLKDALQDPKIDVISKSQIEKRLKEILQTTRS